MCPCDARNFARLLLRGLFRFPIRKTKICPSGQGLWLISQTRPCPEPQPSRAPTGKYTVDNANPHPPGSLAIYGLGRADAQAWLPGSAVHLV